MTNSELKHLINPGSYFIIQHVSMCFVKALLLANCIESSGSSDHNSFKTLVFGMKLSTFLSITCNSLFGFI